MDWPEKVKVLFTTKMVLPRDHRFLPQCAIRTKNQLPDLFVAPSPFGLSQKDSDSDSPKLTCAVGPKKAKGSPFGGPVKGDLCCFQGKRGKQNLADVEFGEQQFSNFISSVLGFPPPNHNKQKCKMFPDRNHEKANHVFRLGTPFGAWSKGF